MLSNTRLLGKYGITALQKPKTCLNANLRLFGNVFAKKKGKLLKN